MDQTDEQVVQQESNDAFEAGFSEARGVQTPEPQKTEPAPAAPAEEPKADPPPKTEEPKAAEPPAPDPWEGVPSVVKATLDSVNNRLADVDKVSGRLRNVEGHLGGIAQQLKTALATAKTVEKAPTQEQIQKAAASSDRWNRIKEDFPEWAEAMDERLAEMRADKATPPDMEGLRKELGEKLTAEAEARFRQELRKRDETLVEFRHPGWKESVKSKEFESWFKTQPVDVQTLAKSEDAMDAIVLLDKFKAAPTKAAVKQNQTERLRNAVTPQGTHVAPTPKSEDDAFERGFDSVRSG